MAALFTTYRTALLLAALALAACSKKPDDTPTPSAPSGTMTWTNNGTTYTSTLSASASAVQDSDTSLLITGSSADMKNIVSLRLRGIYKTGPGVYQLLKGAAAAGG